MFDRIKSFLIQWHNLKEVGSLTDRDLADLGMTRSQVEAFVRIPANVPDRVERMAAIFGLDAAEVKRDHALWLDLLITCDSCADRGLCARVQARPDASADEAGFCPNSGLFSQLA